MSRTAKGYPPSVDRGGGPRPSRPLPPIHPDDPGATIYYRQRGSKVPLAKMDREIIRYLRRAKHAVDPVLKRHPHPLVRLGSYALDGLDVWLDLQYPGEPIPRDPEWPPDIELSFDPAKWDTGQLTWESPHDYDRAAFDGGQWYLHPGSLFTPPGRTDSEEQQQGYENTYDRIARDYPTMDPRSFSEVETETVEEDEAVTRYRRYTTTTPEEVPYDGTVVWEWAKPKNSPQSPTWANPPRVAPTPRVLPRWRWTELPSRVRHPYSEVGPLPASSRAPAGPAKTDTPARSRPGRGTKEQKVAIKGAQGALRIIGWVTESLDAINALWDVLPEECKSGNYQIHTTGGKKVWVQRWRPSQAQRMGDLYRCFPHMDMQKALEALMMEQIEDAAYGQLGQMNRNSIHNLPSWMRPRTGWQFGTWDTAGGFSGG